ncbi:MAG: tetratricopeptide repeat protein [Kiritimatiellia bacterium]
MLKVTLAAVMGIAFCLSARGAIDFQRHYRIAEAERVFYRKDYVEARSAFKDLAASATDPEEQDVLSARAAIALGYQDGQYTNALEEAAQIANPPVAEYARITLLSSQSDWTGLIEEFGIAPIADWPVVRLPTRPIGGSEDMRFYGLVKRAEAFDQTGAYRQAEQDLEKALEMIADWRLRLATLSKLAALRQSKLDDADGAYDVNLQISALGRGGSRYFTGTLAAANYLRQNGRYDEAVAMIESMNPRNMQGGWQGRILIELSRLLLEAGRPAEAADVFQAIVAHKDNSPVQRRSAALEAAAALSAAGRAQAAIAAYKRLLDMADITDEQRVQAEMAISDLQGTE